MSHCPHCQSDLSRLPQVPQLCPDCGQEIGGPGAGLNPQGSLGSGEFDVSVVDRTMASDEFSVHDLAAGAVPCESDGGESDPGKTMQSDEFDSPDNDRTVQADDLSWSNDPPQGATVEAGPTIDRRRDEPSGNDRTIVSDEFSWQAESGSGSDDSDKTMQSDEFAAGDLDKTVQSDEFTSADLERGDPDRTVQSDEFASAEMDKTVQSDEFSGMDSGFEQTIVSDEFNASGAAATMLSDEMPPEAVKTMQTLWSGAVQGPTHPGMSIKGATPRKQAAAGGGSTLVIKQRQLSTLGEKPIASGESEYELIRVLGEGGMGVVYDARQTSVDRSVAIKMLKPRTSSDERQQQKFLAEAVVTGDLDHPNIVPIYDVGKSERGLLFYAMKKVKGTPWMKLLPQKSQTENIEILMKVGDAVGFAHARGVIHRDLKPENVMLGDFGEVLVMDWGLALPAAGFAKTATISPAHSMGGTPAYMSPEMASGPLEKINFTSDVYLLGAILYEILTGRPPHSGKNTMQCLFAAAKNDIRPSDKTGELMDIALKAMATDSKVRHQTVREFQDAIRDYQSHTESIALSTRAAEEMQKAQLSDDYRDYARALFAFEESLALWDGNARARTGLGEIKLKYAASALKKGDYDLGAGLLDPANPEHAPLYLQLKDAQHERESRQKRLQNLKRVAGSLAALFLVSMTVAFFWIKSARDQAVVAEQDAKDERDKADVARADAVEQKDLADSARIEADKQRVKADAERDKADIARADAVQQKEFADTARIEADLQRDKAVEAQQKEAYEAYVARIGLAAAKIDENAFDSARELLERCARDTPELLNWEWGRLMFLCGQSRREIKGQARLDAAAFAPDGRRFVTGGLNHTADVWNSETGEKLQSIQHDGALVHAVAFSPVADQIATGSSDPAGYLRLVDASTGELVRRFPAEADGQGRHRSPVLSVAFSRDGGRLLSTSSDNTARLWDVATGNLLKTFSGHHWWVWQGAFSPDESKIITVSHDGSAIVWDVESEKQIGQFLGHHGPVFAVDWAEDGRVATGGYDTKVLVWKPADLKPFDYKRIAEGKPIRNPPTIRLDGHGAGVHAVRFSKDGAMLLSGAHDNSVRLWDASNGDPIQTFRGHASWVRACAFSPDERTILSAGYDSTAILWNIKGYEEFRVLKARTLRGHADAVLAASFSHDGRQIVTASRDKTARTWNFQDGALLKTFEEGHAFLASNAVFFAAGTRLATAAVDNTVRLWDVGSGSEVGRFDHTGRSAALAVSHDSRRMITGSDDKTAKLWDLAGRKLVATLREHKYEVTAVAFSPDDRLVFTGDSNGTALLWDAASGKLAGRLDGHTRKVTAAAFASDGTRLLTASNDRTVAQWDVASGKEIAGLVLKHPDSVLSLALLPDNRRALTSCADGKVRLWDLDSAAVSTTFASPDEGLVNAVAVSANGRQALTANSEARTVRLWDLPSGREIEAPAGADRLEAFLDFELRGGQVWTAIFAPDDRGILTVGGSDARLWDLGTRDEQINFSPNGIVASAVFSDNDNQILTGSWDSTARIWTAANGQAVAKLIDHHSKKVNTAAFSPEGTLILTTSDDQTAALWQKDDQAWEVVKVLAGHKGPVLSGVFSPDGARVLTASADATARLWDVATGRELRAFSGHRLTVSRAVFSADGTRIATASEDRSARVWNVEGDEPALVLEGHTAGVSSVAFLYDPKHPGGSRLITGSLDFTAKLWDCGADHGKEILTLKRHTHEITCVDASRSGLYLLTGGRDGQAVVWLAIDWNQPQQIQASR